MNTKELYKIKPAIHKLEIAVVVCIREGTLQAQNNRDNAQQELIKLLGNCLVECGAKSEYLLEYDKLLGKQ
jgi:hypothetical protein